MTTQPINQPQSSGSVGSREKLGNLQELGRSRVMQCLGCFGAPRPDGPTARVLCLFNNSMKYFLDYLVPVAEKAGVRLLLHPNDPPMAEKIAGVPCLLRSPEAFERVFELAKGSEAVGMEFCCGTWMEGLKLEADQDGDGAQGGTSCIGCFGVGQAALLKSLQWFVQQGRVSVVHLRNTSRSLPAFAETFGQCAPHRCGLGRQHFVFRLVLPCQASW
eukprot:m.336217 g.336217  ORF g.336217 m.336217 type:complete len:217 (-) comp19795_c0_seq27:4773-5423(-)